MHPDKMTIYFACVIAILYNNFLMKDTVKYDIMNFKLIAGIVGEIAAAHLMEEIYLNLSRKTLTEGIVCQAQKKITDS